MEQSSRKGLCKYCFDTASVPCCYCLDCEVFLCEICLEGHDSSRVAQGHKLVRLHSAGEGDIKRDIGRCPDSCKQRHESEVVAFSSKLSSVDNSSCQRCVIEGHMHSYSERDVIPISKAARECIWQILTMKEGVHAKASACKQRVEQIEQAMVVTEQKVSKERQNIDNKIQSAIKALNKHGKDVANEIDTLYRSYTRSSGDEKRKLKLQLAQMSTALEQVPVIVTNEESTEIESRGPALLKRFDEVLNFKCNSEPIKALEIEYIYDKDIFQVPDGHISSHTTELQLRAATGPAQVSIPKLRVANFKWTPSKAEEGGIEVNLAEPTEAVIREPDQFAVPIKTRPHPRTSRKTPQLVRESLVLDRRNSGNVLPQFTHEIHPPVSCEFSPKGAFGGTGKGKGEFRNPKGIAINSKWELAIADCQNHRVQVLAPSGKFLRQVGKKGSGSGELQNPLAVAFDRSDNLLVSDTANCNVQMFSPEGKFVKKIGEKEVKNPYGVCVSFENNVIICDVADHTVKVFSPNGERLLRQFGTTIELVPECTRYGPYFAVYHNEQYFASFCGGNHCVKIFDKKGNYIQSVGKEGENAGQLLCPRGLAVSSHDHILVCDSGNYRIQIFTLHGRFVGKFGTKGMGLGQFDKPEDLVISPDSRLYVTDSLNNRVEYFEF